MMGRKEGGKKRKLESDILSGPDFLLCSNEAIDAPRCNKETFPSGSPVAVHTNERSPSARSAFPGCTSCSRPRGDSSPSDAALMCMHLCHIIQALLQLTPTWHLNSPADQLVMPRRHRRRSNCIFRGSYSGEAARLMQTGSGGLLCDTVLL